MSESAIFETARAIQSRIRQAIDGDDGGNQVRIGPPVREEIGEHRVSLFLFHLAVNSELRNELPYTPPPALEPANQPVAPRDALPMDLRFLISVFRVPNNAEQPNELTTLGNIIQVLHTQPTLSGAALQGQVVRVTPEPYPMEELSRVWSLFPQDVYRTSVVYLASPVYVEAGTWPAGPPVEQRRQRSGVASEPPDLLGRRAEAAEAEA
jgi:hypothetical protein